MHALFHSYCVLSRTSLSAINRQYLEEDNKYDRVTVAIFDFGYLYNLVLAEKPSGLIKYLLV